MCSKSIQKICLKFIETQLKLEPVLKIQKCAMNKCRQSSNGFPKGVLSPGDLTPYTTNIT